MRSKTFSESQAAALIGIHPETLARWANDAVNPRCDAHRLHNARLAEANRGLLQKFKGVGGFIKQFGEFAIFCRQFGISAGTAG